MRRPPRTGLECHGDGETRPTLPDAADSIVRHTAPQPAMWGPSSGFCRTRTLNSELMTAARSAEPAVPSFGKDDRAVPGGPLRTLLLDGRRAASVTPVESVPAR